MSGSRFSVMPVPEATDLAGIVEPPDAPDAAIVTGIL